MILNEAARLLLNPKTRNTIVAGRTEECSRQAKSNWNECQVWDTRSMVIATIPHLSIHPARPSLNTAATMQLCPVVAVPKSPFMLISSNIKCMF